MGTILHMLVGVIIAIVVSYYYYKKTSKDLKREIESLHNNTILILRGLKENGIIDFTEDEYGNPKSLIVTLKLSVGSSVSTKARASKKSKP